MGLSLPAEKPRNFKATFKRLMRRLHPERLIIGVVLDRGRVVGVGTHSELMETCETYQEIVYSQLTVAEAAS